MNSWIDILKNDNYMGAMKYVNDGADVNDANENGESVLALALRYRCDIDLVMLIIDNGADIFDYDEEGVSIFDMAVTYDNMEIVRYLIEKGYNVNNTNRKSRFTSLMAAVCYGRVDIVKLLLEKGADKEIVDSKGFSAIDFARKMNKKSILEILDYDENSPKNKGYAR